jgi:prepilin-type N-terminal cleavage/methylation domain-containing protein
MKRKAFTLIELAIALTVIGLMIGGSFQAVKAMREKTKVTEAKEQIKAAKDAVLGFAMQNYYLPNSSEFDANLSTSKNPNHPMFYTADNILQNFDICAFTSTSLIVNNRGSTINHVAFVLAHEGANYNMQTALIGNVVNIRKDNYQLDDNTTPVNINEPHDDVVEWVTLSQLKEEIGCVDKPFRFVTDKLPSGKVGVMYPNVQLVVENNQSAAEINCPLKAGSPDLNISFNGGPSATNTFTGEPNASGLLIFECTAEVDAIDANNQKKLSTKEFSITIDPDYSIGASCSDGSDCSSGYCANGTCQTGAFNVPCIDGEDCKSGICQGGFCSGYMDDACTANSECLSGYCDANSHTCASIP